MTVPFLRCVQRDMSAAHHVEPVFTELRDLSARRCGRSSVDNFDGERRSGPANRLYRVARVRN